MLRLKWIMVSVLCLVGTPSVVDIRPVLATEPAPDDADDPAIWVDAKNPEASLIVGTNKVKAPDGALLVFGLDGKTRQKISGLDRPNNVDVEYGLRLSGGEVDIAVATERLQSRLRIFAVNEDGLREVTSAGQTRVFADRSGEQAAPMGIGLYKRPRDGAIFAIVAPKNGPREGYLGQYRLEDDGTGRVKATLVRYFGSFSGVGEIEAVAVDDPLGFVYYADEGSGVRKYHADPDHPEAARELAFFAQDGFQGHREGIAIYQRRDGTGYILCTDQIASSSEYHIYRREGERGQPHNHERLLKVVRGGADATDGLEVTSHPLGRRFPTGLLVAMNSSGRNFLLFRWDDVAMAGTPRLRRAP